MSTETATHALRSTTPAAPLQADCGNALPAKKHHQSEIKEQRMSTKGEQEDWNINPGSGIRDLAPCWIYLVHLTGESPSLMTRLSVDGHQHLVEMTSADKAQIKPPLDHCLSDIAITQQAYSRNPEDIECQQAFSLSALYYLAHTTTAARAVLSGIKDRLHLVVFYWQPPASSDELCLRPVCVGQQEPLTPSDLESIKAATKRTDMALGKGIYYQQSTETVN
jgi:hypothetical protein